MRPHKIVLATLAVVLLAAGCSRGGENSEGRATDGGSAAAATASGDFGDLKNICHSGKPTSAPAQGVTAGEIKLGVFTDVGFTKNPELVDAAKVFTGWCNDAGGVNGRRLVTDIHDAKLMEVRQRMLDACRDDFALVGGGAALDGLAVKDRLSCLLPDFPAQPVQVTNIGSDLQAGYGTPTTPVATPNAGYYKWLATRYPGSGAAIGIINGDSPMTKPIAEQYGEIFAAQGDTVVYNDLYPAAGVTDWTPYAVSIKAKGVKGLIFLGDFHQLAKLEDVLTDMDYKLDWIDANSNAYSSSFLQLASHSIAAQHNYVNLAGVAPLSAADTIPAVAQVKDLYKKYAPGADVTEPALHAFIAWALFAKSASACGDAPTRKCVLDHALAETAWTGGGLQAPQDLSPSGKAATCYDVQVATAAGWQAADFGPENGGVYRCDTPTLALQHDYGKPLTLADVGKSSSDLK